MTGLQALLHVELWTRADMNLSEIKGVYTHRLRIINEGIADLQRSQNLLRVRVAGDTVRDLIDALRQLDPDLKHNVRMVRRHTQLGFAQSEKAQLAMDFNS